MDLDRNLSQISGRKQTREDGVCVKQEEGAFRVKQKFQHEEGVFRIGGGGLLYLREDDVRVWENSHPLFQYKEWSRERGGLAAKARIWSCMAYSFQVG